MNIFNPMIKWIGGRDKVMDVEAARFRAMIVLGSASPNVDRLS